MEAEIYGTWRMVSCKIVNSSGKERFPFGEEAEGYISYGRDGFMSAMIVNPNRKFFKGGDLLGGTDEEKLGAAKDFLAYYGTFEVNGNVVSHQLEGSFFPNWMNESLERMFEIKQGKLYVKTYPYFVGGEEQIAVVIFEKR